MNLSFKKYLWIPKEIEEIDYKNDKQRLRLIVRQIFHDIYNMHY